MDLLIIRSVFYEPITGGELLIDGIKFCDTLEDTDRKLSSADSLDKIKSVKKQGVTAIPTGTYDWKMEYSPSFKRVLPTILNVPGFTGVRIHGGNTVKDTAGCPLVGIKTISHRALVQSQPTLEKLIKKLKNKSGKIEIISI